MILKAEARCLITPTALAFPFPAIAINIHPRISYVRRAGAVADEIVAGAPGQFISPFTGFDFKCRLHSWNG